MDMNKYNEWPANHKGDQNPSPKILALGKRITDVAGHMIGGVKAEDPEYWGLAEIITEEMAEVGLTMKRRVHYTFDQLCEMNKGMVEAKGKEGFQKLLDEMSYIGLLEYDYGYHYDHNGRTAPQSERRYTLPMFVPGSAELFNMEEDAENQYANPRLEAHPDLAAFFERMTYIPLDGITQMVPPGGAGVGMHVIPVEKAISMENEAIDIEKLSYWLSKYEGKIGVGRCSCRASRKAIGEGVRKVYEEVLVPAGMGDVEIYTELGRFMLGPYGCLVTKAIHEKHTHKEYIGVDACAANLMRPAMYGAYHHITVMGKENEPCDHTYDVTGSLCENNDKFAIDRQLPKIDMGDLLVIHDTGAHGFSMGYNYNGRLRSAEVLLKEDGGTQLIRRAETPMDYFATFDCFPVYEELKKNTEEADKLGK